MKKQWLYILGGAAAGFLVARLLMKSNSQSSGLLKTPDMSGFYRLGEKSKDIEEFQRNLNAVTGKNQITNMGTYDKVTLGVINEIMGGTSVLIDEKTGAISKSFIRDFNLMLSRCKNAV